jgi:predicted permease
VSAPRWTRALLARVAEPDRVDEVLGDLDEAHRIRIARRGCVLAVVLTSVEALDMALALRWQRGRVVHRMRRTVPPSFRAALRRGMPPISWLDFKLGLRMLARYPGMTVVGGAAMALGIAIGVVVLQLLSTVLFPERPFAEPDRIVTIRNIDTRTTQPDLRALHDLETWRAELRSVERIGASYTDMPNFAPEGDVPIQVRAVSISASAFGLSAVPPVLGRPLLPSDEPAGAQRVVVLADWLWRTSFGGDSNVVGRTATLGGEAVTVVGVMPPGFTLDAPSNDTNTPFSPDLWTPLRFDPLDHARGEGPPVVVFGRLAPGVSAEEAQAELTTVGAALAADSPETHGQLVPEILTFRRPLGVDRWFSVRSLIPLSAMVVIMIMAMLCANVALLMFARAAAREGEIVVRSALGASRARIVGQLFAEAAGLAGVAIVVGLAGASWALRWIDEYVQRLVDAGGGRWAPSDTSLSSEAMLAAVALALIGAAVAGVLPGLKVTSRRGRVGLQQYGGRAGTAALSRVWSAILVTQVALTTTVLPISALYGLMLWTMRTTDPGLPADEYLTTRLELDGARTLATTIDDSAFQTRYRASYEALALGLASEPGVSVTLADQLPGFYHPRPRVEVEDPPVGAPAEPGERAQVAYVDPTFFDVMGAEILSGRGFGAADLEVDARAVIVNESFVRQFLGDGSAVGRRIRYPGSQGGSDQDPPQWLEIVGVAEELAMYPDPLLEHNAGVYHPLRPGFGYPIRLAVHVPAGPDQFVRRVREIARDVAPDMRLWHPIGLDRAAEGLLLASDVSFKLLLFVGGFAILLTNAGIYSIISFSVSRRTREIGVRVALGADRSGIVSAVLSAMARRVALGVALGAALGLPIPMWWAATEGPLDSGMDVGVLVAIYLVAMVAICMAACIVPTRRALAIQPTEALAAEG